MLVFAKAKNTFLAPVARAGQSLWLDVDILKSCKSSERVAG